MLDTTFEWSSQYSAYTLPNNDVILVTCEQEFLFSYEKYPLLCLIDGKRTVNDIASQAKSQRQANVFLSVIKQIVAKSDFLQMVSSELKQRSSNRDCELKALSTSLTLLSKEYDEVAFSINEAIQTHYNGARFVVCHNLMSKPLFELLNRLDQGAEFIVVAISSTKLLISPSFDSVTCYRKFAERLQQNSPVVTTLKPFLEFEFTRPIPPCLAPNALSILTTKIAEALAVHVNGQNKHLTELSLFTGKVIEHTYIPFEPLDEINGAKITLHNRAHFNCDDGGSRCVKAADTVAKILPFVSPYTGFISHIEPIKTTESSQITIFRTGFFKTVPFSKIHTLKDDSFIQVCLGKGVSKEQSMASALCEAIERKNAQFVETNTAIKCRHVDLDSRAYGFEQLTFYSDNQFSAFAQSDYSTALHKIEVKPFDNSEIHWQPTWSLSHSGTVYVPSVLCFANTPFAEDKFGKWQSNGCAAGNNVEEAILQALFELIERDATAIWWYNKLERPSFDLTQLDPHYFNPLHQTLSLTHEYWVLDLTIDTGIPVMAAIGRHKLSNGLIFGFGCHLRPEMAAQRALTELCQLIPIRDQNGAPFDFDAIEPERYLFPNHQTARGEYALSPSLDIKEDILAIVEILKGMEFEVLALDYSRPPLPISTVKVFIPGFCHIWPQLGNKRLYETPVKLGWRNECLNEQTINQQGLYI